MAAIFANDPFGSGTEKEKLHNSKLLTAILFVAINPQMFHGIGFQKSAIGTPGLVLMAVDTREN